MGTHQWFKNGDHPNDYTKDEQGIENGELVTITGAHRRANGWEGGVVRRFRHPDIAGTTTCAECGQTMHVHGWIDSYETSANEVDGEVVCPGDRIEEVAPGKYRVLERTTAV